MTFLKTFPSGNMNRVALVLIIISIIGFFGIAAASVRDDSLTIDETAHIVSGYTALQYGTFNINLEHPPLVKMVAAIPLLFTDISYIPSNEPAPDQWAEGNRFLFSERGKVDTILWRARLSVLAFNALLLCAIAYLAWKAFDHPLISAGLVFFLAFDPNILAHARFVTTDVPIALSIVGLALALLVHVRKSSHSSIVWIVALFSLVLLTKFSGLLAFVLGLLCFLISQRKTLTKKRALIVIFLPLLITYFVYLAVNVRVYPSGLDYLARQANIFSATVQTFNRNVFLRPITSFAIGASATAGRSKLESGTTFTQFLNSEGKDRGGWWSYFPLATLYKETPAFLLLLFSTCLLIAIEKGQRRLMFSGIAIPGVLLTAYLLASISSDLNIGIRHFLPVLTLIPLCAFLIIDRLVTNASHQGRILLATFYLLPSTCYLLLCNASALQVPTPTSCPISILPREDGRRATPISSTPTSTGVNS